MQQRSIILTTRGCGAVSTAATVFLFSLFCFGYCASESSLQTYSSVSIEGSRQDFSVCGNKSAAALETWLCLQALGHSSRSDEQSHTKQQARRLAQLRHRRKAHHQGRQDLDRKGKVIAKPPPRRPYPPLGCEQFTWPANMSSLALVGNGPLSQQHRKEVEVILRPVKQVAEYRSMLLVITHHYSCLNSNPVMHWVQGYDAVVRYNKMSSLHCGDKLTFWVTRYSYEAPDKFHGLGARRVATALL